MSKELIHVICRSVYVALVVSCRQNRLAISRAVFAFTRGPHVSLDGNTYYSGGTCSPAHNIGSFCCLEYLQSMICSSAITTHSNVIVKFIRYNLI